MVVIGACNGSLALPVSIHVCRTPYTLTLRRHICEITNVCSDPSATAYEDMSSDYEDEADSDNQETTTVAGKGGGAVGAGSALSRGKRGAAAGLGQSRMGLKSHRARGSLSDSDDDDLVR